MRNQTSEESLVFEEVMMVGLATYETIFRRNHWTREAEVLQSTRPPPQPVKENKDLHLSQNYSVCSINLQFEERGTVWRGH